jgi:hypothetical protein
MRLIIRSVIAAILGLLCTAPVMAGPEEDSIRQLLFSAFDKPNSRLDVEPIVVAGDYAIAGWSQSDMGGRALLRRRARSNSPAR